MKSSWWVLSFGFLFFPTNFVLKNVQQSWHTKQETTSGKNVLRSKQQMPQKLWFFSSDEKKVKSLQMSVCCFQCWRMKKKRSLRRRRRRETETSLQHFWLVWKINFGDSFERAKGCFKKNLTTIVNETEKKRKQSVNKSVKLQKKTC